MEIIEQQEFETLAGAMAAFHRVMPAAIRNKSGRFGKYATLQSLHLVAVCATRFGIGYSQDTDWCEGAGWHVKTVVTHIKSGETKVGRCPIVWADNADPQKFGSGITYSRKFGIGGAFAIPADDTEPDGEEYAMLQSLATAFGITAHVEDDDGEAARPEPKPAPTPETTVKTEVQTPDLNLEQRILALKTPAELKLLFNEVQPSEEKVLTLFRQRRDEMLNQAKGA